jgi:hypothetical protein
MYVASGNTERAKVLIDSLSAAYAPIWGSFAVVYAVASNVLLREAALFVDGLGTDYLSIDFQEMWALALWESRNGATDALNAVHEALIERRTRGLNPSYAIASLRKLEEVVQARLLLAKGDSSAAIAALRGLRPEAPAGAIRQNAWDALAAEQVLLARLLMARADQVQDVRQANQDYQDALDIALNVANGEPVIFVVYLRSSLEIAHRAAIKLGDTRLASEAERRLAELDLFTTNK